MSERILVCGSLAFDTIAVFDGHFKEHILSDSVKSLSVSFLVPSMRKEYGGCAGNISYNLSLLGAHAVPVGAVGIDANDYLHYLRELNIDTSMVMIKADTFSAQCFITTDLDGNQIASFHPGAMSFSSENDLTGQDAAWGIVAPDSREGMFANAERLHAQGTPFVFDLGQAMPLFTGDDLNKMLNLAQILTANDYEGQVIAQRTGKSMDEIAATMQAVVITRGAEGATLYTEGTQTHIDAIQVSQLADPTGCGDSHRAGLLYGLTKGWNLYESCCLGNVMGSIKIASQGPQNHKPSKREVSELLKQHYGIERTF
ncbi:carbohydrate kinase family protein [Paenalcaligenes niemegkensis]|uniref:carbohydrate kinase family protein n=1 Tax=Paenalcaligenes niemegkensis TaxID=2895469 RepID=UPI001EE813C7|nr:carbohydrate kinase family protein [Paenalcaligenes niemegkensis]MCQ9615456.1 carbohydrate kinase family protein [Paenalcaligenes niemegkensis]